jgi:cytochrome c oxidase assembly protein subunit 15
MLTAPPRSEREPRRRFIQRRLTSRPATNPWLHRFAVLTATATLFLIWMGGLVTSHGVGMAVPDWPTTYGYNMFFFPFSKWMGGIFYEHSHRLVASVVGVLTAILAAWIWGRETNGRARWIGLAAIAIPLVLIGVRTQTMFVALAAVALGAIIFAFARLKTDASPLRWLALIAFAAVLVQGVLGGLRVTQLKDEIGIFHATLAQLFFALICVIAVLRSQNWVQSKLAIYDGGSLRYLYLFATGMIVLQLIIGASMRHQHAGLAIPDFPLAYGKLWPATDTASVAYYNSARPEVAAAQPITALGVWLQMLHRLVALSIAILVGIAAVKTRNRFGWQSGFTRGAFVWMGLICCQILLGAGTIWTSKSADIATAHVAVGALSLVTGAMMSLWAYRCFRPAEAAREVFMAARKSEVPA